MNKSILMAAIAGAVLIGAVVAAIQPIQQAQTVHTSINTEINDLCKTIFQNADFLGDTANQTAAAATTICTGAGV